MNQILANKITVESVIALNKKLGYTTFYSHGKGINLNIGVVRSTDKVSGTFNDIEFIMYEQQGRQVIVYYEVTCDPSRETLINLPNKLGAAIIVPGQHRGCWRLDYHKGRKDHPALVQIKPIPVIRDYNKDINLDFKVYTGSDYIFNTPYSSNDGSSITYVVERATGKTVQIINTGLFGINNHRASKFPMLNWIGAYSQGCIVHRDYTKYMNSFIKLLIESSLTYGKYFTITVYTEEQFNTL